MARRSVLDAHPPTLAQLLRIDDALPPSEPIEDEEEPTLGELLRQAEERAAPPEGGPTLGELVNGPVLTDDRYYAPRPEDEGVPPIYPEGYDPALQVDEPGRSTSPLLPFYETVAEKIAGGLEKNAQVAGGLSVAARDIAAENLPLGRTFLGRPAERQAQRVEESGLGESLTRAYEEESIPLATGALEPINFFGPSEIAGAGRVLRGAAGAVAREAPETAIRAGTRAGEAIGRAEVGAAEALGMLPSPSPVRAGMARKKPPGEPPAQEGFGIGEEPGQGQMLPEFRGEGGRAPFINEESLAAQEEARRLRALGQQEFPRTVEDFDAEIERLSREAETLADDDIVGWERNIEQLNELDARKRAAVEIEGYSGGRSTPQFRDYGAEIEGLTYYVESSPIIKAYRVGEGNLGPGLDLTELIAKSGDFQGQFPETVSKATYKKFVGSDPLPSYSKTRSGQTRPFGRVGFEHLLDHIALPRGITNQNELLAEIERVYHARQQINALRQEADNAAAGFTPEGAVAPERTAAANARATASVTPPDLPPSGGGAAQAALPEQPPLPPTPVGAIQTNGHIAGAELPPLPTPDVGGAREFWARPLPNAGMVSGAFQDNFWRSAADRQGLRQATAFIDPAALVSGTAQDAVSIVSRGLLLRNRTLDVGESGVNAGMAFLRERPTPFTLAGDGRIPSLPGKPLWNDVFDNPGKYKLTPEQTEYVKLYQDMLDDALALAKQNGIEVKELTLGADRHYIPRLVEALRGIENEAAGRVGGRVGAKAGFQKTRWYEWAEEGVANGVVYSNDPLKVMEHHVRSTYKLVADKRLGDEVLPLGETITERMPPAVIKAADDAKAEFRRARELLGAVNRAYRGERLPPSLVTSIGKSFPQEAAALKVAGPNSPALQPIEASARNLMAQSRTKWQTAVGKRALARERAMMTGFDEAYIPQPFAGGRIFPKEVAQAVTTALGDQGNQWLHRVQVPSMISRTLGTTIDFGAPFIQGLGVLGENPGAWARATLKHYQAFLDPASKQRYYTQNADVIREMAQYGANVGGSEFFAGNPALEGLVKKLPENANKVVTFLGKQTGGRFQEAFGTFIDAAGIEMWKGLRATAKAHGDADLFALADVTNHMRGTMSQRAIGVGPTQRQVESAFLMFAPRYTKAGFALLADMATAPDYLKGNVARANLTAMIGSATTFFLAGALAMNKLGLITPEEVQERLTPIRNGRYNSKFLTLPIGTDDVGMGGFGYSILRLLAGSVDKALNEPADLLKWDAQDNPLMGFFRSRIVGGAPAASLAIELFTGQNYIGEKLTTGIDYAKAVGRRLLPFWAESYVLQEPRASLPSAPFATQGFRVFPESYGTRLKKLEEQEAEARNWKLPLSRAQKRQLEAELPEYEQLRVQAETQSEKFVKNEVQQQTANVFADIDQAKVLREQALASVYRDFLNGKIDGNAFREARATANKEMGGAIDLAKSKNPLALVDRAAREAYYRENRIEVREGNPMDIAAEGYYGIDIPLGREDEGFDARREYLKQFDQETQNYILKEYPNNKFEQGWMNEIEKQYARDQETLRPYWEVKERIAALPPHNKLTAEELEGPTTGFGPTSIIRSYKRAVDREKERIRKNTHGVLDALRRWGYGEYKGEGFSGVTTTAAPANAVPQTTTQQRIRDRLEALR